MKEKLKLMALLSAILLAAFFSSGCASFGRMMKGLVGGNPAGEMSVSTPRFSDTANIPVENDRQYKRMNRNRFEEEAELAEGAGSLWVMEGQGAYLFSQNQTRMVGDLLNVNIEGGPKTQLQTKVRVIARLLERIDNPSRGLASAQRQQTPQAPAQPAANPAAGQPPSQAQGTGNEQRREGADQPAQAAAAPGEPPFNVQTVPTRIVEQLKDGSYRVRGMQPFMIGRREYKVIVTGIVRPEDFDDGGINASKLLDPQFDIVSSRRGAAM